MLTTALVMTLQVTDDGGMQLAALIEQASARVQQLERELDVC